MIKSCRRTKQVSGVHASMCVHVHMHMDTGLHTFGYFFQKDHDDDRGWSWDFPRSLIMSPGDWAQPLLQIATFLKKITLRHVATSSQRYMRHRDINFGPQWDPYWLSVIWHSLTRSMIISHGWLGCPRRSTLNSLSAISHAWVGLGWQQTKRPEIKII